MNRRDLQLKTLHVFNRNRGKFVLLALLSIVFWLWLPATLFRVPYSKVLVDHRGELMAARIAEDGQWRFPPGDSIPERFKTCLITFEDQHFYTHPGVNPVSIVKALLHNSKTNKGKHGGSTLTMQVARMMHPGQGRSYWLKAKELALAIRIELSYSKEEILELYCAHAPFGSNVVGLKAAAWRYFGRSPEQLSWAESALLAVLPNAPALIYPGKNQDKLMAKRNRLLGRLYLNKHMDESTYRLALQEPLPEKPYQIPQLATHLIDFCIKKYPGLDYYHSSVHINLQNQTTALLNKQVDQLKGNQINNACALIIENASGKVLAYVGNSGHPANEHENFVDIVQAPRSTGSILKPFLYAFMLNENKLLPSSLVEDVPTQIASYGPRNFNLSYDGLVPANQALARSLNVPAVKQLQEYGLHRFHERLRQLGFTTFHQSSEHYGLSLILGGGEATLWQLATAYSSMARALSDQGQRPSPASRNPYFEMSCLAKEAAPVHFGSSRLLKPSTLYSTFAAMTELLRPQDYIGWSQFVSKQKIAWKTGTSFGFRDAWAIGLNPRYTVAVWVGNANGEGRPELTGTAAAAPLMFAIFNSLEKKGWFRKPDYDFDKLKVCVQSGYRASDICPETQMVMVPSGGAGVKACPFHQLIHTDETGLKRVNAGCYPVSKMQHKPWFVISPLQELYFKNHSLFYKPLPPFLEGCGDDQTIRQMELIYPKNGDRMYLPVIETGDRSLCVFSATHKDRSSTLFWHLDGVFMGSTKQYHQLSLRPAAGKHELLITDSEGASVSSVFEVLEK